MCERFPSKVRHGGFSNWLYKVWSKFLTQFGKLKVLTFGHLPILAYDPDPLEVDGYDIEKLMSTVQPGDVLIRGYNKYLDGKFIPDEIGYSHAGLYIGGNEVVHSASPSVAKIHLIDFCQADRIMLLRPIEGQEKAIEVAKSRIGVPYDFNYETDLDKLYCFELIAVCYPQSDMKTYEVKKFLGLVKRECYIAKSIYQNGFFIKMFERNKKYKRNYWLKEVPTQKGESDEYYNCASGLVCCDD